MTQYEIKCEQTFAWYEGFVHDYDPDPDKQQFYVSYPNDWKVSSWEKADNVRPPPSPMNLDEWNPRIDEKVECQAKAGEKEPMGWWPCTIRGAVDSNEFRVSFDGWGDAYNEVLSKALLRPRNTHRPLSESKRLARKAVPVPPELVEWIQSNPTEISDLRQTQTRLVHMNFIPDTNEMILVAPQKILDLVVGLIKLHFSRQSDLLAVQQRARDAEEKLARRKKDEASASRRSFRIHPLLIGYVYGAKGRKVAKWNERDDIVAIRVVDNSRCEIKAKNEQVAEEALEALEIVARKVLLSSDEIRFIFGRGGSGIEQLRKLSQIQQIISAQKFPEVFRNLKERYRKRSRLRASHRGSPNSQFRHGQRGEEDIDIKLPPEIENATEDDIFEPEDIITLSTTENPQDGLILISGRQSVNLCITMIELTLMYYKKQNALQDRITELRRNLNRVKGKPDPPPRGEYPRYPNRPRDPHGRPPRGRRTPRGRGRDNRSRDEHFNRDRHWDDRADNRGRGRSRGRGGPREQRDSRDSRGRGRGRGDRGRGRGDRNRGRRYEPRGEHSQDYNPEYNGDQSTDRTRDSQKENRGDNRRQRETDKASGENNTGEQDPAKEARPRRRRRRGGNRRQNEAAPNDEN